MSRLQSQTEKPPRRQSGNSCQDEFISGDQWNLRGTGTQTDVLHARLGLKPADHNEECRARIVRHMTADDNLKQRVQTAQDRIVETTLSEARIGERDPVPETARKKVRLAERVEEQTPDGTVGTKSRTARSSSSSPSRSRINQGIHVACRALRTTVDVGCECPDPIMSDRSILVVQTRMSKRELSWSLHSLTRFGKMSRFATSETLAV